jgi:hypothetical protein
MDVFKLAFETVIIGLFVLPWLWVMIDLTKPDLFTSSTISPLIASIPAEVRPHAMGLTLFPLAYLLGLVITPVASEFLNDPDMLGGVLPNEEKIQAVIYARVEPPPIPGLDMPAKLEPANFRDEPRSEERYLAERRRKAVQREFSHEESTLLLRGPEGSGRINRLHERLTVLQGATFSAFALTMLCSFAWCGRSSKDTNAIGGPSLWRHVRRAVGLLLSLGLIAVAVKALVNGVHHPETGDMPVAELVFMLLGGFGSYVAISGTQSRLQFHGLTFVFALFFALLCYGGYVSTQTSYDLEIFNTYQALPPANATGSAPTVAQTMLTIPIAQ